MTVPFTYPATPHVRRHGPQGYADYASYRPWLRDEYAFRCVYCLLREQWGVVRGTFALDHFLPVAVHPQKVTDFDNLVYSCASCNAAKGSQQVPDPGQVLVGADVRIDEDGKIEAGTPEARRLIRVLGLDDPEYTEFRLLWIGIVSLATGNAPDLYRRLMGFPENLPDLSRLRPPGGNARPAGVANSYLAQRRSGVLPETY
jgi:hypothetical protein